MTEEGAPARRGRPKLTEERIVYRALLDVARECLAEKSYNKITVREIAGRAGINVAMINYYFGAKAGLFIALMEDMFEALHHAIRSMDRSALQLHPAPNRLFAERLMKFMAEWHPVLRLFSSEVAVYTTNTRDVFRTRNAQMIYNDVLDFVEFMVMKKIYRADLNARAAAMMISGLIIAPFHFTPFISVATGMKGATLEHKDWSDSVAAILDNFLSC
jgi:AcrR family transcriptional regulator